MKKIENSTLCTKSGIILLIITLLCCITNILCYCFLYHISVLYTTLYSVLNVLLIAGILTFYFLNLKSWFKIVFICSIVAFVVTWGYYLIVACGLSDIFSSKEALQDAIASTGGWGMLVYTLMQFLQVTFIPLPAMLTTIVGAILFGPLLSAILSLIGIMAGSFFAFWLGDKFGEKLVVWIAGKEQTEKYSKLLYDKGKYLFFLMMLFPLFPDDLLCLLAGMTAMTFRFFFVTILITRPVGILMTCYLGGGTIIPYEGWGLVVWAVIIAIMAVLFICSYKYQDKIEKFVTSLAGKRANKKKIKPIKTDVDETPQEPLYLNAPLVEADKNGLPIVVESQKEKSANNEEIDKK